jgi:hypothetical protein
MPGKATAHTLQPQPTPTIHAGMFGGNPTPPAAPTLGMFGGDPLNSPHLQRQARPLTQITQVENPVQKANQLMQMRGQAQALRANRTTPIS